MTTLRERKRLPAQRLIKSGRLITDADPYEMANLYPRETGLPMTLWAGPRAGDRHDARVKVCRRHGDSMDPTDLAVVAIRPSARVVHGPLPQRDFALVAAWIELNHDALFDYWNGTLGTAEFVAKIQRIGNATEI
jgi:hypothetical protein